MGWKGLDNFYDPDHRRVAGAANGRALAGGAITRDVIYAAQIRAPRRCVLRSVGLVNRTAYVGTAQPFRIGLYEGQALTRGRYVDGQARPNGRALVAESIELFLTTAFVPVTHDFGQILAADASYWLAVAIGGAVNPNLWGLEREGALPVLGLGATMGPACFMTFAQTYAALASMPDPFPAASSSNATCPAMFFTMDYTD